VKNPKTTEAVEEMASNAAEQAHESFTHFNSALIKAIERNRTMAQQLMRAMQEESLRFVNTRLERTGRVIERSRDCQGVPALMALQHDWLMDIARDYAELNKRFGEVLREATEQSTAQAEEALSDAARKSKPENLGERAAA